MAERTAPSVRDRVVSGWIWCLISLIVLASLPRMALVYLATARRDPGRYAVGRCLRQAAVACVKVNTRWDFDAAGVRIRDPRRPYVCVANHESFADIFLISHLPWEMKWLAKESLFRIPVLGWMLRMAGDIPVRRESRRSRGRALEACRDRLERNVSVIILPEGTRSTKAEILPFHDGAFHLAVEAGVPVLPIAVAGTRSAMPKGSLLFSRARAAVRVLEPVETRGLTREEVPVLRERVRSLISDARDELFRELAVDAPSPDGTKGEGKVATRRESVGAPPHEAAGRATSSAPGCPAGTGSSVPRSRTPERR